MTQTIPQDVSVLPIVRQHADEIVAGGSPNVDVVAFRMWLRTEHPGVAVADSGKVLARAAQQAWLTINAFRERVIDEYRGLAAQAVELATSSSVTA